MVSSVPTRPYEPRSSGNTIGAHGGTAARASSSVSAMMQYDVAVLVIDASSRPAVAQCWASTSYLWATTSGDSWMLHRSPYFATSLRVTFSPPPATITGTCGVCTPEGWFTTPAVWKYLPANV